MEAIQRVKKQIFDLIAPPPDFTVSEWADAERRLSSEASAEPGRWRTDRAPYQKEILDAVNDVGINKVVIMSSAQIGKTEILLNLIGYYVTHDPSPILLLQPTLEMAQTFSKDRLAPMARDTPCLKGKIADAKSRSSGNTMLHKSFAGGHITMAGANSAASLASRPIRILLADEIDRYPVSAGTEGDPVNLAIKRTTTFWNRKIVMVSTPTIQGLSRIETAYEDSTKEVYQMPCPSCGEYQQILRKHLVHTKEDEKLTKVEAVCNDCGSIHSETEWKTGKGRWFAQAEHRNTRGFHLNEYVSPWRKWLEIELDFIEAKKSTETLKTFINTSLGETWEEQGDTVSDSELLSRREVYPQDIPVSVRTMGCDVQKDRIECTVYDWGKGEEAWAYDHLIIPGDTATKIPWNALEDELNFLNPDAVAVDHGYNSGMVDDFVADKSYCHAVKGVSGTGRNVVQDKRKRLQNLRKRRKKSAIVEPLGVDQAKALLLSRLKMQQTGDGYIHFPITDSFDEEFFKQLTAEKLVTKYKSGRPYQEWVAMRKRNETTDCYVYALAALRLSDIDVDKALQKRLKDESSVKTKKVPKKVTNKFKPSISLL